MNDPNHTNANNHHNNNSSQIIHTNEKDENDYLPFLISHWLSTHPDNPTVRAIGSQLASTLLPTASASSYTSLHRQWSHIPHNHLTALITAGARVTDKTNLAGGTAVLHKPWVGSVEGYRVMEQEVAQGLRKAMDLKLDRYAVIRELRGVQRSLKLWQERDLQMNRIDPTSSSTTTTTDKERTIAHLTQRSTTLHTKLQSLTLHHTTTQSQALDRYQTLCRTQHLHSTPSNTFPHRSIPQAVWHRQHRTPQGQQRGVSITRLLQARRYTPYTPSIHPMSCTGGTLHTALWHRMQLQLQHQVTINTHLFYPIYCLAVDRTGGYIITGADDHLVKVFTLGGYTYTPSNTRTQVQTPGATPGTYHYTSPRGCILAMTLRGHSDVITDVDVNCNNQLLASASEDGTVRVWGMCTGGCVAVLQHVGGDGCVGFFSEGQHGIH